MRRAGLFEANGEGMLLRREVSTAPQSRRRSLRVSGAVEGAFPLHPVEGEHASEAVVAVTAQALADQFVAPHLDVRS